MPPLMDERPFRGGGDKDSKDTDISGDADETKTQDTGSGGGGGHRAVAAEVVPVESSTSPQARSVLPVEASVSVSHDGDKLLEEDLKFLSSLALSVVGMQTVVQLAQRRELTKQPKGVEVDDITKSPNTLKVNPWPLVPKPPAQPSSNKVTPSSSPAISAASTPSSTSVSNLNFDLSHLGSHQSPTLAGLHGLTGPQSDSDLDAAIAASLNEGEGGRAAEMIDLTQSGSSSSSSSSSSVQSDIDQAKALSMFAVEPPEVHALWLNACLGALNGDLKPMVQFIEFGGDRQRKLSLSDAVKVI
jgi:hypothetical protein